MKQKRFETRNTVTPIYNETKSSGNRQMIFWSFLLISYVGKKIRLVQFKFVSPLTSVIGFWIGITIYVMNQVNLI